MEIAIAVAGALAIIFGISITVASHYHKNSLIVWFTYLTVIFALLVPFLYWQKRENERQARAAFSDPLPVIAPSPKASPSPSPSASPSLSPPPAPSHKPKPKASETPTKEDLSGPPRMGHGSGAPSQQLWPSLPHPTPYDHLRWTDYTEDYFFGAIWRWKYRPEMGDKEPRNIYGYCPDCNRALTHNPFPEKRKPEGFFTKALKSSSIRWLLSGCLGLFSLLGPVSKSGDVP